MEMDEVKMPVAFPVMTKSGKYFPQSAGTLITLLLLPEILFFCSQWNIYLILIHEKTDKISIA